MRLILQAIKNWSWGRPGNEASYLPASRFCFASVASLALFPDLLRCPSCNVVCDCLVFLTWVVQVIVCVLSSILYPVHEINV